MSICRTQSSESNKLSALHGDLVCSGGQHLGMCCPLASQTSQHSCPLPAWLWHEPCRLWHTEQKLPGACFWPGKEVLIPWVIKVEQNLYVFSLAGRPYPRGAGCVYCWYLQVVGIKNDQKTVAGRRDHRGTCKDVGVIAGLHLGCGEQAPTTHTLSISTCLHLQAGLAPQARLAPLLHHPS